MVVPSFDLTDSGGIGLVLTRGVVDAVVLTVCGTLVFLTLVAPAGMVVLPRDAAAVFDRRLTRLARGLAVLALLALAVWLVLIGQSLADVTGLGPSLDAAWTVILSTSFGHIVVAEAAALLLILGAIALPIGRRGLSCGLGVVLAGLQACHGHAYGMGNPLLLASLIAHLLAASAWLGALPVLAISLIRLPPLAAARLAQRFSPLGLTCVLVLAVSALYQAWALIGGWGLLLTSAYGWTAVLKALLFALLLALAAFNKFFATPHLAQRQDGRPALFYTVVLELVLGLAVLLAAGLLASLPPPGMKM